MSLVFTKPTKRNLDSISQFLQESNNQEEIERFERIKLMIDVGDENVFSFVAISGGVLHEFAFVTYSSRGNCWILEINSRLAHVSGQSYFLSALIMSLQHYVTSMRKEPLSRVVFQVKHAFVDLRQKFQEDYSNLDEDALIIPQDLTFLQIVLGRYGFFFVQTPSQAKAWSRILSCTLVDVCGGDIKFGKPSQRMMDRIRVMFLAETKMQLSQSYLTLMHNPREPDRFCFCASRGASEKEELLGVIMMREVGFLKWRIDRLLTHMNDQETLVFLSAALLSWKFYITSLKWDMPISIQWGAKVSVDFSIAEQCFAGLARQEQVRGVDFDFRGPEFEDMEKRLEGFKEDKVLSKVKHTYMLTFAKKRFD